MSSEDTTELVEFVKANASLIFNTMQFAHEKGICICPKPGVEGILDLKTVNEFEKRMRLIRRRGLITGPYKGQCDLCGQEIQVPPRHVTEILLCDWCDSQKIMIPFKSEKDRKSFVYFVMRYGNDLFNFVSKNTKLLYICPRR